VICAIIITYNPNLAKLTNLVDSLRPQVQKLIIVDNTPSLNHLQIGDIELVDLETNIGIGAAQNIGLDLAFELGAKEVILFDQDSTPPANLVSILSSELNELNEKQYNIAAIGPTIFCELENRLLESSIDRVRPLTDALSDVNQLISSGMLIPRRAYEAVGGMDEDLFIDAVDHEWCWRARSQGLMIVQSKSVQMKHLLGEKRYKVLGIWTKLTAPERLYFQFRNVFWLLNKNHVPFYWKLRNILAMPIKVILVICLHPDKASRLRNIYLGLQDGLKGKPV
jgi:rhamnosyltransferase|tara:strand:- start:9791 stop:10633 length:843 start_codon:yes stop_codon:yes gene_type:complete